MIDWKRLKKYCKGDYTLIENYDKALNDPDNTWICHHRNGILLGKSVKELKKMGLYEQRPPDELMFLTEHDHNVLHNTGSNNPFYGKGDTVKGENNPFYNKHHTEKSKQQQREKMIGNLVGEKNGMYGKQHPSTGKHRVYDSNGKFHYEF